MGREAAKELTGLVCKDCFNAAIYGEGLADDGLSDARLRILLPEVASAMGRIPMSDWRSRAFGLRSFVPGRILDLVVAAYDMPTISEVNRLYGSWLQVLIVAGIVEDGLPSSRGRRSISNDGHACFSEGERTIDDWLHANGLAHEREPLYPGTNFRGDFRIGETIVEYYGLAGNEDYDARKSTKQEAARAAGIRVIGLYASDVSDWANTQKWFADMLGLSVVETHAGPTPRLSNVSVLSEPWSPPRLSWDQPPRYTVAPGFYADPFGDAELRYNTGTAWSYRVMNTGSRPRSHSPGVRSEIRDSVPQRHELGTDGFWVERSDFQQWSSDRYGTVVSARNREAPPPIDIRLVQELVAWMDICDNDPHERVRTPYVIAAHLFSRNHHRGAEAAVVERFRERTRTTPDGAPHSDRDLARRHHLPDPVQAHFGVRGQVPNGDPVNVSRTRVPARRTVRVPTLRPAPHVIPPAPTLTKVAQWLVELGEANVRITDDLESPFAIVSDNSLVHVHASPGPATVDHLTWIREAAPRRYPGEIICCFDYDWDFEHDDHGPAWDYADKHRIALVKMAHPDTPEAFNFRADAFVQSHEYDDILEDSE